MSARPGWIPGDPWMICDLCGGQFRRSQIQKRWDGLMVCKADFEPRHPQDIAHFKGPDKQAFKDARPRQADRFLADNEVQATDFKPSQR